MELSPTDKDIMKLVFHWTTVDQCDGFRRREVMKLNHAPTQLATRIEKPN
jgi:hypothetical protein